MQKEIKKLRMTDIVQQCVDTGAEYEAKTLKERQLFRNYANKWGYSASTKRIELGRWRCRIVGKIPTPNAIIRSQSWVLIDRIKGRGVSNVLLDRPCKCGALPYQQEWVEDDLRASLYSPDGGEIVRNVLIYCPKCGLRTKLFCGRRLKDMRADALYYWEYVRRTGVEPWRKDEQRAQHSGVA